MAVSSYRQIPRRPEGDSGPDDFCEGERWSVARVAEQWGCKERLVRPWLRTLNIKIIRGLVLTSTVSQLKPAMRRCLFTGCYKEFLSRHISQRICPKCRAKFEELAGSWRSQVPETSEIEVSDALLEANSDDAVGVGTRKHRGGRPGARGRYKKCSKK